MNRRTTAAGSLLAFALLVAVVQPSCTNNQGADDGGECGPNDPNLADSIGSASAGADPDGVPAVELTRYREGKCGAEGGSQFWVRFENGAISTEPAPAAASLDFSA